MITLDRACSAHTPQLQALWQTCFGDGPEYTGRFFDRYPAQRHAFAAFDGDKVVAMALWLPQTLRQPQGCFPAAYLYAVATDPTCRSRGICRQLMAYTEQTLAGQRIACTTLVPGESSLFDFYAALGYETAFYCDEWQQAAGQAPAGGMRARPVSDREYAQIYRALLPASSVEWDAAALRYQSALCQAGGGALYALTGGGCAVCERMPDGLLFIKELLLPEPARRAGVQALLTESGAQAALVRAPQAAKTSGRRFGMLRWLIQAPPAVETAYLGLAFD